MKYIKLDSAYRAGIFVLSLFWAQSASAYNPSTHAVIADQAVSQSSLVDTPTSNSVLSDLGLSTYNDGTQLFPNPEAGLSIDGIKAGSTDTVEDLIRAGAAYEDSGARSVNHFYDPAHNMPLTINLNSTEITALSVFGVYPFSTSPDWALKDAQAADNSNIYALADVNDYFYRALTDSAQGDRNTDFGYVFDGLGHVLHHIGDMAQPQHVRNDMHCDLVIVCGIVGLYSLSAYESLTEANVGRAD